MDKREAYELYFKLQVECFRHQGCHNCPFVETLNGKKICILTTLDDNIVEAQVKFLYNEIMFKAKNEQLKAKETKEINLTLDAFSAKELNKKIQEHAISVAVKADSVNSPKYYYKGGLECIQVIKAQLTPEQYKGYLYGNVLKYMWRWQDKNGLEDLKKAEHYLHWLIEKVEKNGR